MNSSSYAWFAAWAVALAGLDACGSSAPAVQYSTLGDAGFPEVGAQQASEACAAGVTMCLHGTARTSGYTSAPLVMRASLYRVFPSARGGAAGAGATAPIPLAAQLVARDGTWAFDADAAGNALDAWGHYYVEVVPTFDVRQAHAVSTRVGPLALPADGAAAVAVVVEPVQLDVLEQGAAGLSPAIQWATAHLFDPVSGDEVPSGDASASLWVGGEEAPLAPIAGALGYSVEFPDAQFPAAPAATPTYRITTSPGPGAGAGVAGDWTLVATPPSFVGEIAAPPPTAQIAAGSPLTVTWPLEPEADYELVELFQRSGGAWVRTFASPSLDSPSVNVEKIPGSALPVAGTYLLNVAFTRSNCPAGGDGCVHASTVANEELTVQ